SHCSYFYVLCLAGGALGDPRGRHSQSLGAASPLPPDLRSSGRSDGTAHARHRRPANLDAEYGLRSDAKVRGRLLEGKGIEILGGFGPLAGKVFRIGIMGSLATEDHVEFLLDELRKSLNAEGYRPQRFSLA